MSRTPRIYLDNAAATPLDAHVLAAMRPYWRQQCGNPSSLHGSGRRAARAVEAARGVIAERVGSTPGEVVFTSGGTEANNLAILGFALANSGRGRHVVVSAIEHPSVLEPASWLERNGFSVTRLPVDGEGLVDPDTLAAAVRRDTILVSIMHVNNEVGAIQPVAALCAACRERDVAFHTDACQGFGREPIEFARDGLDLVSINAHKLHGPKGVGALIVRRGVKLEPLVRGGGQEDGLRSGTSSTPLLVGFSEAARLCTPQDRALLARGRDRLLAGIKAEVPGARLNGPRSKRQASSLSLTFPGLDGRAMQRELDKLGVDVSTGAACASDKQRPSHVLVALGLSEDEARSTLRLSVGRFTTDAAVDRAARAIGRVVSSMGGLIG